MFGVEEIQSLNELELAVYEYVMLHKNAVSYMRIRELAAEAHVSTTTVIRFCKKMGCDGYAEFKLRMKEYIGFKQVAPLSEDFSEIRTFFDRCETDAFQKKLEEAAAVIAKTERLIFVGIGNSGYVGQYGARYFTNLGKFSLCISDPFYPINMKDAASTVAMILSVSGESRQVVKIANGLKRSGCRMISITNTEQCTISRLSDVNLPYYITMLRDEDGVDYTSQMPVMYVIEELGKRIRGRLMED